MSKKTKICKNCNAEIDSKAVLCPSCGVKVKKPFYKKWWFIIFAAIIVIAVISSSGGNNNTSNSDDSVTKQSDKKEIEYTEYSVAQMISDLEENALKAENTYKNKYVKITGELTNIDSGGKYISLYADNDSFSLHSVQCYIKSDEQKNAVMNMSIGDTITVKGKVTDIGEILGYQLNIDSIE